MSEFVMVRISIPSMWQCFNGCEPEYIRTVCFARCCDAPGRPSGTMISIHPSEVEVIVRRGGEVRDGLLVTDATKRCTFKDDANLCSLHFTPDKPFGCIASPFTLNKTDMLVVRNRYRSLTCYRPHDGRKGDGIPAFMAFEASLRLLFDNAVHTALRLELVARDKKGDRTGSVEMPMRRKVYEMLKHNDETKVLAKSTEID